LELSQILKGIGMKLITALIIMLSLMCYAQDSVLIRTFIWNLPHINNTHLLYKGDSTYNVEHTGTLKCLCERPYIHTVKVYWHRTKEDIICAERGHVEGDVELFQKAPSQKVVDLPDKSVLLTYPTIGFSYKCVRCKRNFSREFEPDTTVVWRKALK
jgi:hypothetical protein